MISFLGIAYLLRALSGMADVAAWGAVLAVLMTLFPTKVSKIVAWTEMFFGLGYTIGKRGMNIYNIYIKVYYMHCTLVKFTLLNITICLGPALGSFLYSAGGFVLPFEIVGTIGILIFHIINLVSMKENYYIIRINIICCNLSLHFSLISKVWLLLLQ